MKVDSPEDCRFVIVSKLPGKPWIGPKWFSSPYNFDPKVVKQLRFPKKLGLYDVACRDGEQRPGVVFSRDDRVKFAKKLDEVGIQRIEAAHIPFDGVLKILGSAHLTSK